MDSPINEPVVIGYDPVPSTYGFPNMVAVTLLLPDVPPRGKPFPAPLL